jgi:hypothetical protein
MPLAEFVSATFSKETPNKLSNKLNVSGRNTLIQTEHGWRLAIADEPIDGKVDGKKMLCICVDNAGDSFMMFGFTPMETFDSDKKAYFGNSGLAGAGIAAHTGNVNFSGPQVNVIDKEISVKAKEIIVVLTISNNGTKKEIHFLCDGHESKSTDVSQYLNGDRLFAAITLASKNQQVTTIPIDQIKTRTPAVENLIKECQQQHQNNKHQIPLLPSVSSDINNQVISQLRQRINDEQRILIQEKDKQIQEMRKNFEEQLKNAKSQMDEFRKDFLKQLEIKDKQLESTDQQFQREREISNTQLELERAENQQLRNLLQHEKDEMSAMEIHYLKRESGQRRGRAVEEPFLMRVQPEPEVNRQEQEPPLVQETSKKKKVAEKKPAKKETKATAKKPPAKKKEEKKNKPKPKGKK